GPSAGGPPDQVVALGDVRGAAGGLGVCRGGGEQVASSSCRPPRTALEQQILRHRGLLVSWTAPLAALHLMSGADQRFSTWNTHSAPRSSRRRNPLRALRLRTGAFRGAPGSGCPIRPAR